MKVEVTQVFETEVKKVQCGTAEIFESNIPKGGAIVIKDAPLSIWFDKDKNKITIYLNDDQAIYITPTDEKPIIGYTPDSWNIKAKAIYPTETPFYKLIDYDSLRPKVTTEENT